MALELEKILLPEEYEGLRVAAFTPGQREMLVQCFMRAFQLGEHVTGTIEKIKYNGRLVILDDDSRWDVDELDADTACMWDVGDEVVIVDGKMYKLDEAEAVTVEKDDD